MKLRPFEVQEPTTPEQREGRWCVPAKEKKG